EASPGASPRVRADAAAQTAPVGVGRGEAPRTRSVMFAPAATGASGVAQAARRFSPGRPRTTLAFTSGPIPLIGWIDDAARQPKLPGPIRVRPPFRASAGR